MVQDKRSVEYLNFLYRRYEAVTKIVTGTKQQLVSIPGEDRDEGFDTLLRGEEGDPGLETIKNRILRGIEKELNQWDVWTLWLKAIPGIGPAIAAGLILKYYYKFVPVCKDCGGVLNKINRTDEERGGFVCVDCGKKARGDGVLEMEIKIRDFPTISKWWAFMGRHTVDGVVPKRKKGTIANWSTPGRTIGYQIGDQFNRQKEDHPYKAFLLERKLKHERNHPEWKKGHIHNAAKNEAIKLFLSHFWTVARTLAKLPVSEPYSGVIMGHTNIVKPFYWMREERKTA